MQKAVNVEAKAGLKSSIMVQNSDIHCHKSHCSSNIIASKVQTQETIAKDSHLDEPKVKKAKLTLSRVVEASKPSEQACKE